VASGPDVSGQAWRLGAAGLAAAYARGETDPLAVLDAIERRIARINPVLNAIIARNPAAREEARLSAERHRAGRPLGALDGVPCTVKDSILAAGMPCTWGSRALEGYVPPVDELPVRRLRAAGAIMLGKTNVPEFTLEGYTRNPLFGVTRNPWNPDLTPGGSSGGAVAAVASGLGAFAIGTDGGGSIRRPACHTGLVGMKPSIGRVARGPSLPQILLDFEVIGPIARSTADAALVLRAISGPDPHDQRSLMGADGRPAAAPLRLLYVPRLGDAPVDPQVLASADAAARALAELGIIVAEGTLPFDLTPINEFWPVLGQVGAAHLLARHPGNDHMVGDILRGMAEAGRRIAAERYLAGIEATAAFRREVAECFENIDLIMTPSAAALPWPAEQPYPALIDGRDVGPRGHAVYTGWVNACGHPAIALPGPPAAGGLPTGFQLVGRFGADQLLLEVAARYEASMPWSERWPPLALQA
jgi:aspartyl-tRNA(Asn)/glutamyl-tRNA(Gln) amidotransferase subunit A